MSSEPKPSSQEILSLARRSGRRALDFHADLLPHISRLARVGGWFLDAGTGEGGWTEEVARIHDLDPSEPISMDRGLAFYTPESRPLIERAVKEALERARPYDLELEIVSAKGVRKWVRTLGQPVVEEGRVIRLQGSLQDITDQKQAEAALRASEGRLRLFIDHAPGALAMFDREMRYLAVSHRWLDDYGLTGRDILGKSHYEIFPEVPDGWKAVHQRGLAGEVVRAEADRFQRQDGSVQWLRWEVRPWHLMGGGVGGIVIFSEDISERVEALEALRATEEMFATAFAENPAAMALTRLEDGTFLDVNATWEALTGHRREEAVGHSARTMGIWPTPEAAGRFVQELKDRGVVRGWEQEFHTKAGKPFVTSLAAQILTIQGEPHILSTLVDITQRKQAEAALMDSQARFQSVFKASPAGMVLIDPRDHHILEANPAFLDMLGLDLEEVRGRTTLDLDLWARPQDREDAFQQLRAEGRVRDVETDFVARGGRIVPVLYSTERVKVGDGEALLTLVQDQTLRRQAEAERRRLEAEVAHAQKLESLGALAGGVSHDMNNVLAAIMALASMLKETREGDAELSRAMDTLLLAAGRGRDLVKGLTDFARKEVPEPRLLDLNDMVKQEATLLTRTTLQKVEVHLSLQEGLPPVMGDPGSVANALMNLCVNALDAMPSGGRLTLATGAGADGEAKVSVRDTGQGMSPEVLRRATEPFFTTKPAGKGTGLGLALVYGVMKAHGGRVELASEPGRGTEITLCFPPSDRVHAPASEANPGGPEGAAPRRILLVDDDDLIRSTVPAMLEALGHEVAALPGGLPALQRLQSGWEPDLVILDLSMPGMDGEETLGRIRLLMPDLPILLATGYQDERSRRILDRFPGVGVIMKPFTLMDLKQKLGQVG